MAAFRKGRDAGKCVQRMLRAIPALPSERIGPVPGSDPGRIVVVPRRIVVSSRIALQRRALRLGWVDDSMDIPQ
jgi:hypothetical protein